MSCRNLSTLINMIVNDQARLYLRFLDVGDKRVQVVVGQLVIVQESNSKHLNITYSYNCFMDLIRIKIRFTLGVKLQLCHGQLD